MAENRLIPAAVFGGLLALGMIGGGALIGQGVVHARVGDRSVSVRPSASCASRASTDAPTTTSCSACSS